MEKSLPASAGNKRDVFDSWIGKISWRRTWQPTPVFLAGESHEQKSLEGYSLWDCKELDTTEQPALLHTCTCITIQFQAAFYYLFL